MPRHRHRHGRHRLRPLNELRPGCGGIIMSNPDHRTVELGLFSGARIRVEHNDLDEPNMVVAVGESRYAIPKVTAGHILVR